MTEIRGVPFRAEPSDRPNADGSWTWFVEYQQARGTGWHPLGEVTEVEGRFERGGAAFGTLDEALAGADRDR